MDKEGLPPGSALVREAMKGGDAASLLGRMPSAIATWCGSGPSRTRPGSL